MATVADDIMLWVQTTTGAQPYTLQFPEAASQTFKMGWIVDLDANGNVTDPASDTPTRILGIAAEDAHSDSVAGTHVMDVYLAHPANVFACNIKQSGLANHVLVQSDIGHIMGIQRDTVNNHIFGNASVVAAPNARIWTMQIAQNQPSTPLLGFGPFGVGDTNVRLTFQFIANFTFLGTS